MLWLVQLPSAARLVGFWIFVHKYFFINCFKDLQQHHSVKLRKVVFFKKQIFLNLQKVSAGCESLEALKGSYCFLLRVVEIISLEQCFKVTFLFLTSSNLKGLSFSGRRGIVSKSWTSLVLFYLS